MVDEPDDHECELDIEIEEDPFALAERGIELDEFESAVRAAVDDYSERLRATGEDEDVPLLEDVELLIRGRTYRLGDLAEVKYGA